MVPSEQALSTIYGATITLLATVFSDNGEINKLSNSHYRLNTGKLTFSLQAVYHQIKTAQSPSYNHYRRMIFASSLNQDLLPYQLKVISCGIESSTNTPLYCLMPITIIAAGT